MSWATLPRSSSSTSTATNRYTYSDDSDHQDHQRVSRRFLHPSRPGPSGIGQEAAAVGEAFHLDVNDFIFGSHRAHCDILAKGLSAIEKLSDDELLDIMKNFLGGKTLSVVEKGEHATVKDLAIDFLLYGAMSEIFARETGFNRGLGGSMHTFFTPFGIYPNNAIVGGSGTIAMGAALYKRVNRKGGIVVANIGDGALGRGPVLEALNMSAWAS